MGLDMSLSAKRYMWYNEEELKNSIASHFDLPEGFEVKEVIVEAAYWRKANQIHDWFVRNCQSGVDDCGHYYVSREQIQFLIDLCKNVLQNKDQAETILPTASGFFFGNTEYNEWYFNDIEDTITKLERVLTLDDMWDFEYHSSW